MIEVTPTMRKFVVNMGELGSSWGVNRTVAQIHSLLYLSPKPLHADAIGSALKVARSNVSNGLRELQHWGVIRPVRELGDRREYYESMKDVYEMFRIIIDERKRREVDPLLRVVQECVKDIDPKTKKDRYLYERLRDFETFFESANKCYEQLRKLPVKKMMNIT